MRHSRTVLLIAAAAILATSLAAGQELSLGDNITYKKIKLMTPTGSEATVLVGRFTGKVEYMWTGNTWQKAPPIYQSYYDNKKSIRSRVGDNAHFRQEVAKEIVRNR